MKSNHPFSSISLVEKISEIAPFIEYPIVIETGGKIEKYIPFLPGNKTHAVNNIKEYFEVTFDDIEGIEGKLLVCSFHIQRHIVFAQKGFSIPYDKLLPYNIFGRIGALTNIQASINLAGQYKVSLSPNRLDVVEDEKCKKLIDRIQSKILEAFEIYLKTLRDSSPLEEYVKCVNELLEKGILSCSHDDLPIENTYESGIYNDKIEDIFSNYVPLLTISDEGQRLYKTMKDFNETSLAITCINDWPEKIPDAVILKETKRLVGVETILLMHEEEGRWRRDNFIEYILGDFSDIYITSIPGIIIKTLHNDKANEGSFFINHNRFTYRMHSDPTKKAPLFVHPPDFDNPKGDTSSHSTNFIYNAHHPLFKRLLDGEKPKDKTALEAMNILISNIKHCLFRVSDKAHSFFFKRNHGLEESANLNYMLIGILKYHPEIFKEFSEAVELYWEEAKDLGVVSRDEDFIGFSLDDLPWFWNCELSDFKFE